MLKRILIALSLFLFPFFPQESCARPVRLVFTGDIMVHDTQLAAAKLKGQSVWDFDYQFELAKPFLKGDAVIGNLETVLAGKERRHTGYPAFNSPDSLARTLREAGFDALTLSNNHTFDRGSSGARRTAEFLSRQGFRLAGLSVTPPLILELDGLRVGLLNASYGVNGEPPRGEGVVKANFISKEFLERAVRELRMKGADCVVACLHWGDEYKPQPNEKQKTQARWAFEAGADIIVGTHPHVLQPIEFRKDGKLIFWSLGNFVSGQRTLPRERTVIAAVDIELDGEGGCRILQAGVVPAAVLKAPVKGREAANGFVIVPAGMENARPEDEAKRAAAVHKDVLKFLKITGTPRADGFWNVPQAE
ncbi:MAG: CapA family protein [Mailhella sp.]|nr:CapA family protein [Mailhella sp.]